MTTETDRKNYLTSDSFDLEPVIEIFQKQSKRAIERITTHGRPLHQIEKYLNSKIKDDPLLVKQLLRVFLSAYTNEPINVGVLAPSSEGKTYATVEVSEIFPENDVISVGRLSPTSLIHEYGEKIDSDGEPIAPKLQRIDDQIIEAESAGDKKTARQLKNIRLNVMIDSSHLVDLTHKIILFLDNPKPETYEMLKPILSHDKKEIQYRTTKSDGSLTVKKSIIRGWPAVIVCSAKNEAKNEVWEEIATRFFIISPNTNISKYHEANKLTSQKIGKPSWASGLYCHPEDKQYCKYYIDRFKDSLTLLCKDGNNPVFNPFSDRLADLFPHNQGVSMRHFKRVLSFCNIETLINANSLMKLEFTKYNGEKENTIITSIGVIKNAINIIGKISTVPPEKIKFYEQVFLPALEEKGYVQTNIEESQHKLIRHSKDDITLSSAECAEVYIRKFTKPITNKQVLENYLKPLVDEGLLESIPNPENKSQKLYSKTSELSIHNLEGFVRNLIETIETDFVYIWTCLARLGQASIEFGKITRIYDQTNPHITFQEFREKIERDIPELIETSIKKRRLK
ncbi:MAG: hypothetical protein OEM28_11965 [Nitrosopumilus sp.]|nr:hypothetical protein [Nitrosopumilus sp.]